MLDITLLDRVGTRILIAKKGESLGEFSKRIGISQGYLSQILSGKNKPSPKVAYKIAHGLNLEIEDIFLLETIDISMGEVKKC